MKDNAIHTAIEIERKVLGALIVNPELMTQHYDMLSIHLFSALNHQTLFKTLTDAWNKHGLFDILIISTELQHINRNDLTPYAVRLYADVVSTAHTEHHIMLLVQLSVKRDFIQKFSSLLSLANASDSDIFDIRDKAFEYFDSLFIDRFIENNKKADTFPQLIEKVQERFESLEKGKPNGIESSLNIINKAMGGWQDSNLTVVAGRPGMGKTAFLIQQTIDAVKQGKTVGIFSLEMKNEQIAGRIVTNYANIPNSSILRKGLNQDEIYRYIFTKEDLLNMKIHIDDTSSISIENLKMKAKMMKLRYGIDILLVDYLQLIRYDNAKNREQEIAKISGELKGIAKDLNIPVIALSQLSRNVEQRADKRPFLADLRDSGAIEQDADEVIFLYRPEYYGIEQWGHEYDHELTANEAEIILAKNRNGGTLSERCTVNMATSKFINKH
ncbi:MAG: replicative DNA helicase [Capnocytophaga sp.]|nr:replicative DNA helicase [Capnocytophaga sp.]